MEGKRERGGEGKEEKEEREGKREESGRRRRGGGGGGGGGEMEGEGKEERRGSRANQSPLLFFPYGGISRPSWHCRTAHRGPSRSAVDRELH